MCTSQNISEFRYCPIQTILSVCTHGRSLQARTRGWESVHAGGLAGPAAAAAATAARQAGSPAAITRKLLLHVQRQLRHLQTGFFPFGRFTIAGDIFGTPDNLTVSNFPVIRTGRSMSGV